MAVTAAQLNVIISATGAKEVISDLNQIDGQVKKAAGGFDAFYDRIGGGAGNALRALDGVARVMGSIAVIGGVSLIAGGAKAAWDQVSAVEQATVALRAYESDAGAVNQVLEELIAYARSDMGVLFQRQDLFQAAQGLKMYGAETSRLTEYVKIMSRSVGLGLSTWTDLNRVIGRVGATGRLAGDDFDYLRAAGFMLDDSLRNTNITFEQLFAAMDAGIPADALAGQADTIRGAMIRLQTGLRNIGLAFLDVDSETSKFVEGGLGDKLRNALFDARGWIDNFTDAARSIGNGIASAIEAVENMAAAYQSLPGWMQTAVESITKLVVAFGALRVAGSALGMIMNVAGLGGLVGGVQSLAGAFTSAGGGAVGFRAALAGLLGAINPVGLAITAVGIGLGALAVMWGSQQREIKATEQALDAMTNSYLDLIIARNEARVAGDLELDRQLQQLQVQVSYITQMSQEVEEMYQNFGKLRGVQYSDAEMKAFKEQYELTADEINRLTDSQNLLSAAFQDTRIDGIALSGALQDIYDEFARGNITGSQAVDMIEDLSLNTSRYVITVEEATAATSRFSDVMGVINGEAKSWADAIMNLNTISDEDSFITRLLKASGTSAGDRAGISSFLNEITSVYSALDDMPGPDASHADWMEWVNEAEHGTAAWKMRVDEATAALQDQSGMLDEAQSAMQGWLSTGDNFLDFWLEFDRLSGNVADGAFRDLVQQVRDFGEAADNLDRALYYFQQIDTLGQRSSQSASIAETLIGTPEEIGVLGDLLEKNLIGIEQYNSAMADGTAIIESNARTQDYLNKMRADQLPLLAEEQAAYEQHIAALSELPAIEQRRALALMDSNYQTQLASLYSTAYAASLGEIPEEVASSIIINAAEADPIVKDLLLDFGLIEEGADGEIRVNFPDGPTVQDAITELTRSIDALTEAIGGIPPVRIDTSEISPAIERLGELGSAARSAMDALLNMGSAQPTHGNTGVPVVTGLPQTGSGGTVTLDVVDNVTPVLDTLTVRLFGFDGLISTTTLNAEPAGANTALDNLADRLSGYRGLTSTTTLDANTIRANQAVTAMNERLDTYAARVSTTTLDANSASAHQVLSLLEDRLNGIDNRTAIVYIHAIDFATSTINSVSRALTNLDGRSATTYTNQVNTTTYRTVGSGLRGYADGGIVRDPVVMVGERGPELVALPYGSEVFSNTESMAMLREAASRPRSTNMAPIASSNARRGGTTQVVNNYYQQDVKVMTSAEWEAYKQKSERGNAAYSHLNDPDAHNYGGGI